MTTMIRDNHRGLYDFKIVFVEYEFLASMCPHTMFILFHSLSDITVESKSKKGVP